MIRELPRVREGGFEPPRPFGHWHLKPARLPFRHSRECSPIIPYLGRVHQIGAAPVPRHHATVRPHRHADARCIQRRQECARYDQNPGEPLGARPRSGVRYETGGTHGSVRQAREQTRTRRQRRFRARVQERGPARRDRVRNPPRHGRPRGVRRQGQATHRPQPVHDRVVADRLRPPLRVGRRTRRRTHRERPGARRRAALHARRPPDDRAHRIRRPRDGRLPPTPRNGQGRGCPRPPAQQPAPAARDAPRRHEPRRRGAAHGREPRRPP